jgi:hypothetical protein
MVCTFDLVPSAFFLILCSLLWPSDNSDSKKVPLSSFPFNELDQLRHKYVGYKLLKKGEQPPKQKDEPYIYEDQLPSLSKKAAHIRYPYQSKQFRFDTNKHGQICWIDYM